MKGGSTAWQPTSSSDLIDEQTIREAIVLLKAVLMTNS
jgi:hypothetical protein